MKRMMELNGVANIDLMLQIEVDIKDGMATMNEETMISIKEQLVLLERYMLAYNKAIQNEVQTPFWHEIRENPSLYPTNKGR